MAGPRGQRTGVSNESRHVLGLEREAVGLVDRMPELLMEADRIASTVAQGIHGRRRAGPGETFWQFRQYQSGESAQLRRLAALGEFRSSLYSRARVGSGAYALSLAGHLAVDEFPKPYRARFEARPRAGAGARRGRTAGARRRTRGATGADAADREPQRRDAHRRNHRRQRAVQS